MDSKRFAAISIDLVITALINNIPWLLNWIEIFAFIITRKRIGDRIAKTDVIAK